MSGIAPDIIAALGQDLAALGRDAGPARAIVPAVGLTTLRYLWQDRAPAETARVMALTDAHFAPRFGRRKLPLVGFSMGANVTPFYAPLPPAAVQARVAGLALLSPEPGAGFEIVIGGWPGRATGAADVGEAILGAAGRRPLCLFGREDAASVRPAVLGRVAAHGFEGGRHLGKSYDRIAALIPGPARPAPEGSPALTFR